MVGQTISHYKILEKVGQGGMGEVYLAEDSFMPGSTTASCLPPPQLHRAKLSNHRLRDRGSLFASGPCLIIAGVAGGQPSKCQETRHFL